jgi:hypothetical protein
LRAEPASHTIVDPTEAEGEATMIDPFKDKDKPTTAREISAAEKRKQDAKTARLQEARVAKEAADAAKPSVEPVKKRRWAPK